MVTKKDLIVAVLCTFCLTSTLFMMTSTRSSPDLGEYDPWIDLNDDGQIDVFDAVTLAAAAGTFGTPINKTELLYNINDTLATLLSRIDSLNDTIRLLETRIIDLEYDFSLLNPYIVSYNSTYNATSAGTTETLSWVDMPSTSVDISLNTTCYLLIMFSAESFNNNTNSNYVTYIQALVDSTVALPGSWISLTPSISTSLGNPYVHRHYLDSYMPCSYNFYEPSVPAGNYTIKIQWRVTGGTGYVLHRTLTVLALPAQ